MTGRPAEPSAGDLLRAFRGSLASLRAAAETLELHGSAGRPPGETALVEVVTIEARRLSELIDQLERALEPALPRRRASLSGFLGELADHARRDLDLDLALPTAAEDFDLLGDDQRLAAALSGVLGRLRRAFAVPRLEATVRRREGVAVIDLRWSVEAPDLARLGLAHGALLDGTDPPLRATAQAIDGEAWLTVDRTNQAAALHLIVPLG